MSFIHILFSVSVLLATGCSACLLWLIEKNGRRGVTAPRWRDTPLKIRLLILGADQVIPVMIFIACYAFVFTK
jgi:hypothetical protein